MIKVAVIGVGNMGRHHARNYSTFDNVKLVGISDLNKKTGKEIAKLYGTKFYQNYKELIKKEKPDAVSVAVPTDFHYEVSVFCLNKNIAILIEKPLAKNKKEAEEIIKLAKQKKSIITVGHVERFNPAILKLRELVEKKELGEILSIVVKRVGLFPPQIKDVNVVTDIAVHDLDIVTSIIGRLPNSVFATGSGALTKGREDHSEIFLNYGKFGCFIQVNWITPIKIRNLSITGTKGYAELNYITQQLSVYKSNYALKPYRGFGEFKEFLAKFGEPDKMHINIRKNEPLKLELISFINAVKSKTNPKVLADEGLRALMLAESVNRSIKLKKVVKI